METIKVKDMMVPLADYATVPEDAMLYEAILALEEAQKRTAGGRDTPRAVLVLDKQRRVVGKVGQWDVLKGLEPSYDKIGELRETSRYGFSPEFIRSMVGSYGLWRKPLDDLCRKAGETSVKDFMYTPSQGEYIDESASLDEAIHLFIMERHQSLLVTKREEIVGILRMTDVFRAITRKIRECRI